MAADDRECVAGWWRGGGGIDDEMSILWVETAILWTKLGARRKFPLSSGHRREPVEPGRKIPRCPRLGATLVCPHDEVRFSQDADAHERSRLLYFRSIFVLFSFYFHSIFVLFLPRDFPVPAQLSTHFARTGFE